jgi:hypothetical protein
MRSSLPSELCLARVQEIDADASDPVLGHAEVTRRLGGEVDDAPSGIGTAVVDPHHDRPAGRKVDDAHIGIERQCLVRRGETVHIEALAIGCTLCAVGAVGSGGVGRLWQAARSAAPARATVAPRRLSILSSQSPNAISYATLLMVAGPQKFHPAVPAAGPAGPNLNSHLDDGGHGRSPLRAGKTPTLLPYMRASLNPGRSQKNARPTAR